MATLRMVDYLSEGTHGAAEIQHFEVSPEDAKWTQMRASISGHDDYVPEGRYAKLLVRRDLWMSDTPMEWRSNWGAIRMARGQTLIGGLGLGMIVCAMLEKKQPPDRITVVEKEADVLALVGSQLLNKFGPERLRLVQGDVYKWKPAKGERFDAIYFDIWQDVCTDNLAGMSKLHQRFKSYKAKGGWMASWKQDELKYRRQQGR